MPRPSSFSFFDIQKLLPARPFAAHSAVPGRIKEGENTPPLCSSGMRMLYRKRMTAFRPAGNSPSHRHFTRRALLCHVYFGALSILFSGDAVKSGMRNLFKTGGRAVFFGNLTRKTPFWAERFSIHLPQIRLPFPPVIVYNRNTNVRLYPTASHRKDTSHDDTRKKPAAADRLQGAHGRN